MGDELADADGDGIYTGTLGLHQALNLNGVAVTGADGWSGSIQW